jgi:hypothetical protein
MVMEVVDLQIAFRVKETLQDMEDKERGKAVGAGLNPVGLVD